MNCSSWSSHPIRTTPRVMTNDLGTLLGARLRAARKRARLTQEELAARVGKTPESISNIERGQQLPALDTLLALCEALRVTVMEVLDLDPAIEEPYRAELIAKFADFARSLDDRDVAIATNLFQAMRIFLDANRTLPKGGQKPRTLGPSDKKKTTKPRK